MDVKLEYKESWLSNNWCFWTVVLEKTFTVPITAGRSNQPILKEISEEYSWKDWSWSWNVNSSAIWCEQRTFWKRPWYWERLKAVGEGDEREWNGWHHWLNGRVWASCRSWWWTGKPGVLQSRGLQRVGHEWATKLKEQTFGGLVNVCEFQTLHLGNVMNYDFLLASLRELN